MKSPYRLVPIVIAIVVVLVAVWQATRPPAHASSADIAAARALKGECLPMSGGTKAAPQFSSTPVSCSKSSAAIKVVAVEAKASACPAGDGYIQVVQPGVVGEPYECVVTVTHKR